MVSNIGVNTSPSLFEFENACTTTLAGQFVQSIVKDVTDLKAAFLKRDIRIKHPRDLIPLHEHVMGITIKILQLRQSPNADRINQLWLNALNELNGRRVFRIGIGPIKFDCSRAIQIIRDKALPQISLEEINLKDKGALDRAVSLMSAIDNESLGTYFAAGFTGRILAAPDSRCILAKDQDGTPVGYVCGFKLDIDGKKVFYTFSLGRKAPMAKMGIGNLLSREGIKKINDKSIDLITLNVMSNNSKAIALYRQLGFKSTLSDEAIEALPTESRILMVKDLRSASSGSPLNATAPGKAMTSFIIKHVGIFNLLILEIMRRITLLWKRIRSCC